LINDGVKAVRAICSGLRPGVLDDLGLAAAIEWQASEFTARNGVQCQVSVPPIDLHLDGDRATATFRIFQECLTNVIRHAQAKSVRVALCQEEESILLVVEDDGIGFSESNLSNSLGSLGLLGMKERAQFCGGNVQISSSPGNGTTVTVRVPLDIPRAERKEICIS
jgi:signal transduction histidine kinase